MRLDHITPRRFVLNVLSLHEKACHPWPHSEEKHALTTHQDLFRSHIACHSFTPLEAMRSQRRFNPFPGGHSAVVPPDPIPNSEVKRSRADGSVACPCKSRSPPGALFLNPLPSGRGFFFARIRLDTHHPVRRSEAFSGIASGRALFCAAVRCDYRA